MYLEGFIDAELDYFFAFSVCRWIYTWSFLPSPISLRFLVQSPSISYVHFCFSHPLCFFLFFISSFFSLFLSHSLLFTVILFLFLWLFFSLFLSLFFFFLLLFYHSFTLFPLSITLFLFLSRNLSHIFLFQVIPSFILLFFWSFFLFQSCSLSYYCSLSLERKKNILAPFLTVSNLSANCIYSKHYISWQ